MENKHFGIWVVEVHSYLLSRTYILCSLKKVDILKKIYLGKSRNNFNKKKYNININYSKYCYYYCSVKAFQITIIFAIYDQKWQMKNVELLGDMIQDQDKVLKYLRDVRLIFTGKDDSAESEMGFVLEFLFELNEHFTNTALAKSYKMS